MKTAALIVISLAVNLGVFVSFPDTGRFGMTFLYISGLLWTAFAFFLGARQPGSLAGRMLLALFFAAGCLFSSLSFLPQKDNINPLQKLSRGHYPDRTQLFKGLLRLGIIVPALAPPQQPEVLP
jgi:hypothetical protein